MIIPIIGLEVHIELKTKSKMFCSCNAEHFHAEPNSHTCPVCLGLPGALPVPNKTACEWCIKLGLALGCTINQESFFERKNYFYPDLPKGYQISQLQKPFCINGSLEIDGHQIRINRVHQEEDTGKSVHVNGETLLDYNRSGVPLVEIVSEPDINSPEEAKKYLLKMQQIVRYLGISDADIEKGSMRCEPTVNLKIEDQSGIHYTPLVEIKNVASLTGVMTAIQYEIDRQTDEFNASHTEKSSSNKTTRGWNADKNETFLQREKEGSADYRYFPEPDIPPIQFLPVEIEAIKKTLPELPDAKLHRYQQEYQLNDYDSTLLSENADTAIIFDAIIEFVKTKNIEIKKFAKFTANLFLGPIKTYLNENQKDISSLNLGPRHFFELFEAVEKSQISATVAKQLIVESYLSEKSPLDIAQEKGLLQVSDAGALEELAKKVLSDFPKAVEDYKKNPASIGFLIGQLMKLSGGSANPQLAKTILEKLLS